MKKNVIAVCDLCRNYVEKGIYIKLEIAGRMFCTQKYDFCSKECVEKFIKTNECVKGITKRDDK